MSELGVSTLGKHIMSDKFNFKILKVENIDPRAANILKQEIINDL